MADNCSVQPGPPIVLGYPWALRIQAATASASADTALFPEGVSLFAQFRRSPTSPDLLAQISYAADEIVWISNDEIEVRLSEDVTSAWDSDLRRVYVDMVRENESDPVLGDLLYLGFRLEVPVLVPVTRGL